MMRDYEIRLVDTIESAGQVGASERAGGEVASVQGADHATWSTIRPQSPPTCATAALSLPIFRPTTSSSTTRQDRPKPDPGGASPKTDRPPAYRGPMTGQPNALFYGDNLDILRQHIAADPADKNAWRLP